MKERLTKQEIRSREKKKQIYNIAMEMFKDYGYEQTTVRDICKNANITSSSFYNFFGDKDGIILVFLYETLDKCQKYLEFLPENLDNPYQAICNYFIASSSFIDSFSKDIARQTLMLIPKLTNGMYNALPKENAQKAIEEFLNESIRYGSVSKKTDTKAVAEYLLMAANGIMLHWINYTTDESYFDVALRLMPAAFQSVTNDKIRVYPLDQGAFVRIRS